VAAARVDAVRFEYVSPDILRFDPTNPRFSEEGQGGQDAIQEILEKAPHFALELVPSFLENGFIDYEPLVVRAVGDHYVVVEGNRRLAALRHILARRLDYELKSTRLDDLKSVPVLIFPATASDEQRKKEQRVYLGVRHLFGFREWPPEGKARYLDSQIKTEADVDRVARELNIKRHDIQRYLVPYRLRKAAASTWQQHHKDQDFWVIGESLNRAGIKDYIALDVDRKTLKVDGFDKKKLAHLLTFVYGTAAGKRTDRVVKETRQLSTLGTLLQNKRAAAALEKGASLAEAGVLIESTDATLQRLGGLLRECKTAVARFKKRPAAAEMIRTFEVFNKAAKRFLIDGR
jgi:ParB-like nuclease domain